MINQSDSFIAKAVVIKEQKNKFFSGKNYHDKALCSSVIFSHLKVGKKKRAIIVLFYNLMINYKSSSEQSSKATSDFQNNGI